MHLYRGGCCPQPSTLAMDSLAESGWARPARREGQGRNHRGDSQQHRFWGAGAPLSTAGWNFPWRASQEAATWGGGVASAPTPGPVNGPERKQGYPVLRQEAGSQGRCAQKGRQASPLPPTPRPYDGRSAQTHAAFSAPLPAPPQARLPGGCPPLGGCLQIPPGRAPQVS